MSILNNYIEQTKALLSKEGIEGTLSKLNIIKRVDNIEQWINDIGDPKITEIIRNINALITENTDINKKLMAVSNGIQKDITSMQPDLKVASDNLKYLKTDIEEIKYASTHGWFGTPDILGMAKHSFEAIFHIGGFATGIQKLLEFMAKNTFNRLVDGFK